MDLLLLEPALPQHAGRGRPAGQGLPRRRRRHRLRRLALARDLQRPVPRRLAALDLGRRPPLARLPDGPGPARRARRRARSCRRCPTASRSPASSSSSSPPPPTPRPALVRFFHGMGFRKVGRHVSKDVTLYRQGGINLVVNTEREGFAHSAYLTHGVGRLRHRPAGRGRRRHRRARRRPRRRRSSSSAAARASSPSRRSAASAASVMHFIDQSPALSQGLGDRVRRRRGRGAGRRRRPRLDRPCRPDHALRRDAVVAAVLHLDLPHREGADGRHHRPLRHRPQPGDRERRRQPCA